MKYNIEVPDSVLFILDGLEKSGHEAYMVGGCVRDSIMRRKPNDYDICTSATPDEIIKAFPHEEIVPIGLQYGTVTIVINHEPFEVTTYRIDGEYSDNRRPDSVQFTDNLIYDLSRRDFTINAMAYSPKIGLVDLFGGLDDIKNKVIRCVGSVEERFKEDALRILRAIRFEAQFGFNTDYEIWEQIHVLIVNIINVSIERINNEFVKIMTSENPGIIIYKYIEIFEFFIPEILDIEGFNQNNSYHEFDVFIHTIRALRHCKSNDLVTRLALFLHDFGKPHCYQDGDDGYRHFKGHGKVSADMTDTIMKRMKFDNDTRNKVVQLVYYHDATFEEGKKYVKRWLNKIGEEQFRRLIDVRKADIKGHKRIWEQERVDKMNRILSLLEEVLEEESCFTMKDLAVNGDDLIEIGYEPG